MVLIFFSDFFMKIMNMKSPHLVQSKTLLLQYTFIGASEYPQCMFSWANEKKYCPCLITALCAYIFFFFFKNHKKHL